MAVIHLNEKEYEDQVLKAKGLTLVDFWATWCGADHAEWLHRSLKNCLTNFRR